MPKQEVQGAEVEHWIDTALRLNKPLSNGTNYPRISAAAMVKLNNLKNRLQGTRYTLHEAHQIAQEQPSEEV